MCNSTQQSKVKAGSPSHERLGSAGYTPYLEVKAAGARIGIMTCLRCGAAVVIDPRDIEQAMTIHDRWHALMQNTKGEARGVRPEKSHG